MTRDAEVRYSQGENTTSIARFTLAVDRRIKRDEQLAEFLDDITTYCNIAECDNCHMNMGDICNTKEWPREEVKE